MLLQPISDAASRFKAAWFEAASEAAREAGAALVDDYDGPNPTYSGVDLGVGQSARHGESAIFTIAVAGDGRRRVLSIQAGRWQAPELVERLKDTHARYRSRIDNDHHARP